MSSTQTGSQPQIRATARATDLSAFAFATVQGSPVLGQLHRSAAAMDVQGIFRPYEGLSPEPPAQYCPQSRLEPMLLAETRRLGSEVRYGMELSSLEQDDTGVTVVVRERNSGEDETVRADYLVAADGVHSPVRDSLGLATSGCGAMPIFVM